jgi:uncharacterized protein (DUF302 family)
MIDGLISISSRQGVKATADALARAVASHGMTLVARVDHASAAKNVSLELRPTEVLIFGNPAIGTLLMQAAPAIALELPLKVLINEGEDGRTTLTYSDLSWLSERYHVPVEGRPIMEKMAAAIAAVVRDAAA